MGIDSDLSAFLPDPPPPRPARREAAIGEALRRFDGLGEQAPRAAAGARPAPARHGWGRPQIAALASVALVVLVSVPIWWAEQDRILPGSPPPAAPALAEQNPPAAAAPAEARRALDIEPPSAAAPGVSARTAAPSAPPVAAPVPASVARADFADAPALANRAEEAPARAAPARPSAAARTAPPAPPPPPREAASGTAIVVTGSRIERQDFESTTPMVTADEALLENGDWNDCTLRDPRHDADACRAFADPAAPGAAGRAGEQLAEGLALGWQGETDAAIGQFDRAIRTAPDLSIAYLNRGLAWQEKGDLRRALADLNRAVAHDRTSARAYYHRSLLHRARGDVARAEADAKRAIELDPSYATALP